MIVADVAIETQRKRMPGRNEPVLSLTIAEQRRARRAPPRLPNELIRPMLPAAAASVRKRLGRVQKAGRYAFSPSAATVNSRIISPQRHARGSGVSPSAAAPM